MWIFWASGSGLSFFKSESGYAIHTTEKYFSSSLVIFMTNFRRLFHRKFRTKKNTIHILKSYVRIVDPDPVCDYYLKYWIRIRFVIIIWNIESGSGLWLLFEILNPDPEGDYYLKYWIRIWLIVNLLKKIRIRIVILCSDPHGTACYIDPCHWLLPSSPLDSLDSLDPLICEYFPTTWLESEDLHYTWSLWNHSQMFLTTID